MATRKNGPKGSDPAPPKQHTPADPSTQGGSMDAINNPVIIKDRIESEEQHLGDSYDREFTEGEDDSAIITDVPHSGSIDNIVDLIAHKEQYAKFMQEKVTVHINTTNEKNADNAFNVSVNGKSTMFYRGETKVVRRFVVEGLARAKPISYGNVEEAKSNGERYIKHPAMIGTRYGFSVEGDSPRGKAWLKAVLAQR